MLRTPGATTVAVFALALGIGANTAVFSVVYSILLRPFPCYREPDRMVQIWGSWPARNIPFHNVFYADVLELRRTCQSYEELAAAQPGGAALSASGSVEPERVTVWKVNANFFPMIGTPFAQGRGFLPEEDAPGGTRAVVLSWGLWQRRFGGNPGAVGSLVRLDADNYVVVGVLPREFELAGRKVDAFRPLAFSNGRDRDTLSQSVTVFGRLKRGVTMEQAQAELAAAGRRVGEQYPNSLVKNARVWGLREFITRDVHGSLLVLLGAVALVLLMACANVANLLLARAGARHREMAVRTALGASRGRMARQLLSESLLLTACGAGAGVVLAHWIVTGLTRFAGEGVPLLDHAGINGAVLAYTVGISLITTVFFGLAPAIATVRYGALNEALKSGSRGGDSKSRNRLRSALVVAETALALMLVTGAGLLIRSFGRLREVNPGFNPAGVLTANLGIAKYTQAAPRRLFLKQLIEKLEGTPGIKAAGVTSLLPMSGSNNGMDIYPEGWAAPRPGEQHIVWVRTASPGYFNALAIPLKRGRLLSEQDNLSTPPVAVVSETLARRFWPTEDAVGRRFTTGRPQPGQSPSWITIVGVVGDLHHEGLAKEPLAELYFAYTQPPMATPFIAVRTTSDAARFAPVLRSVVLSLDRGVTVSQEQAMSETVARSMATERLSTTVLSGFAVVALVLAAVGIYGVMSFSVSRRTQEIGVRMALGARSGAVVRMVLRQALALAAAGVLLGMAGALALTRLLRSMLFGVSPTDPLVFAGVVALLLAVAALASYVPARRAAHVNPVVALRYE